MRETLAARARTLGPEHPDTLASMEELAVTLDELKKYSEAERLYRKVVETQTRVLGPNHPITAGSKYNLACNAALQGKRDEAITILEDAVNHGLTPAQFNEIANDSDFQSLHGAPRFEELITKRKSLPTSGPSN
jgi:Flp pilus assembly protein TadD